MLGMGRFKPQLSSEMPPENQVPLHQRNLHMLVGPNKKACEEQEGNQYVIDCLSSL